MNGFIWEKFAMRIAINSLIHTLHGKFQLAMIHAGYELNEGVFTNSLTLAEYEYCEAFQFWCGKRMKHTPPPY